MSRLTLKPVSAWHDRHTTVVVSNPEAMTRSGAAWASAFISASNTRYPASIRARTGAGGSGLSSEPGGTVIWIGRLTPSLNGMLALVTTDLMQLSAAAYVDDSGQLTLRITCAHVPVKSTSISSSRTSTLTLMTSGWSDVPS